MEDTKKAIIKTLSFFDLFSFPLTKEELFYYLWQTKVEREIVYSGLAGLIDSKVVEQKNGYYFLRGREEICEARRIKLLESELKMKIARSAVAKISCIPFIKAIFVCNSIAFGLASKDSDIDLFIVTSTKRIWLVRFLSNLSLLLFGLRRINLKSVQNRVCLSFYVDEENLNLQNTRAMQEDVYLVYWLATLLPIYDPENIRGKIILANSWMKTILPNLPEKLSMYIKEVKNGLVKKSLKIIFQKMWHGGYGDLMEKQAKEAQLTKMHFSVQSFQNKAPGVIVNDTMLKFHEEDRRKEYYERWQAVLKNFKFPISNVKPGPNDQCQNI